MDIILANVPLYETFRLDLMLLLINLKSIDSVTVSKLTVRILEIISTDWLYDPKIFRLRFFMNDAIVE